MGSHRRLVLSDAGSQAAPGVTVPGAAAIPAIGESVRYRARDENAGVLRATVRGHHRRGGLDIDVDIPGASEPLPLTNVPFSNSGEHPRGSCFLESVAAQVIGALMDVHARRR